MRETRHGNPWPYPLSFPKSLFVKCQTSAGLRYLRYKPTEASALGTGKYIDIGLGEGSIKNQWTSISRDVQADIKKAQPNTELRSFDAFLVRGSCLIDDIGITSADSISTTIFNLSYTASENGYVTGALTQIANGGSSGTEVTAIANAGFHFVKWSDGLNKASRVDSNVTSNISVSANFAEDVNNNIIHDVHYYASAGGTIAGTWSQDIPDGGASNQVTATPNAGYHFVSWSDGKTNAIRIDTDIQNDINVSASFEENDTTTSENTIVIENAEHGNTDAWSIYDNNPSGASIRNIIDPDNSVNRVIEITGFGTSNGSEISFDTITATEISQLHWKMKASANYIIYLTCRTTTGAYLLTYTPVNNDALGTDLYIKYGLGENSINNEWININRNIQRDIHKAQPNSLSSRNLSW